jgi:hypothetical protein
VAAGWSSLRPVRVAVAAATVRVAVAAARESGCGHSESGCGSMWSDRGARVSEEGDGVRSQEGTEKLADSKQRVVPTASLILIFPCSGCTVSCTFSSFSQECEQHTN